MLEIKGMRAPVPAGKSISCYVKTRISYINRLLQDNSLTNPVRAQMNSAAEKADSIDLQERLQDILFFAQKRLGSLPRYEIILGDIKRVFKEISDNEVVKENSARMRIIGR